MKQSIGLVILQVLGIFLGFFSIFYVAANLSPEIYAIVGIQSVIYGLITVFSNTGFETYAIRNVLYLKNLNKIDEIKKIVTHSLIMRTFLATLLQIPLLFYCYYISETKFDGHYQGLLFTISFLAIPKATLDSASLILKSFNRYFEAVFATYFVQIIGRILALVLFNMYGFEVYIITLIILPIIILIPLLVLLKKYIFFKNLSGIRSNIGKSWKFAIASYISYPFNYLDTLLVTLFLPPDFIGSFTIGKRIMQIGKQFVENIFDPMIQKLIQYKGNIIMLKQRYSRIVKIQYILMFMGLIILIGVVFYANQIIEFVGIGQYKYLNIFIITIYIGQLIHIFIKVKLNFITMFYSANNYLKVKVMYSLITIVFLIIFFHLPFQWIFLYMFLSNIVMFFYVEHIFKTNKGITYLVNIK